MPEIVANPIERAIQRLAARPAVATRLRSGDIAKLPLALRERAQFSSAVDDLRVIQSIRDKLIEWSSARDPQRSFMDRSKFVAEMRREIGAAPGDTGDIRDITSQRRLELIYDFQTQDAAEYARWQTAQDADLLDSFPAQEFIRVEPRRQPREDWPERFADAARQAGDDRALGVLQRTGRMIALKTSPLWMILSRFGKPWPPFDFGSGMGVRDVDREEAESIGLIERDEPVEPVGERRFNEQLAASVDDLDADLLAQLREQFGDEVRIEDGRAVWVGAT